MSKLVVWSVESPVVVAVFADYLERHGCQVISVVPPQDTSCLIRIYARAPEDFDNINERLQASKIVSEILMAHDPMDEIVSGLSEDLAVHAYMELARRADS